MNPLKALEGCGQAPWLDYLKRSFIEKGDLKALVDNDGLKGVTSNPSIFQKAIGESDEYTPALETALEAGDESIADLYERLVIADIRAAADVLRPIYDATRGRDGYVSLECSPYLAMSTGDTLAEARHLWSLVDRPNLMVKVPGTPEGTAAVRELIKDGVNINVTLLFAVDAYEAVAEAYLAGLEARLADGGEIKSVASVASFFVSRIDAAVEKKLDAITDPRAKDLMGKVAIANAKVAYERYLALFSGPRWAALERAGAQTQRLLWASTSTKNPAYKDTIYAEALIGRDTVDTLPPATLDAFRDHGVVEADAIQSGLAEAHQVLSTLEDLGVSLKSVTEALVADGVQQFSDAFDKLFSSIAAHRSAILEGDTPRQKLSLGSEALQKAYDELAETWRREGRGRALWSLKPSLWTGADEDRWGGWLTIAEDELKDLSELADFSEAIKTKGFSDVVLLGMGGSSLGPEVLALSFGDQPGWPRFHMLDSTDPAQIKTLEAAVDLSASLFIVSSKSGGTLEPNIFMAYFYDRVESVLGAGEAGPRFVAVTDPGSSMEAEAKARRFWKIFYGLPSIGGRYSVLSKFGLTPAAATGLDLPRLLGRARRMQQACGRDAPPDQNPGVQLGLALGAAATRCGRDKVTLFASPAIADLGAWLEQLLAESTGKQGKGLIPVAGEPAGPPGAYGQDRFFAYLELQGQSAPAQRQAVEALAAAGHPVAFITLSDVSDLAAEFIRWEIATAVAGSVLGINPFDQPDVEDSKNKTRDLTQAYEASGALPDAQPIFQENGITLYADEANAAALGRHNTLAGYLKGHLERAGAGDYVALLAYLERDENHTRTLTEIRSMIRDRTRAATCVGFGPRFQHSTGQAYKGGPNTGVFLQITCEDPQDIQVPGHGYTFGVVKAAQAMGDLGVLEERGRRALRVHLKSADAGLAELADAVTRALAPVRP